MQVKFNKPRLVVFDLDGTLVDSMPAIHHAANELRREYGLPPLGESAVAGCMSGPMSNFVRRVTGRDREPSAAVTERLLRSYVSLYERASHQGLAQPYAGVAEVLTRIIESGVAIALCTNKAEGLARASLVDVGLARFFPADAIVGFDTLAAAKPDPLPLRHLIRRYSAAAESTWMVGDSGVDVMTARAAGCTAIACQYGYGDANAHQPDAIINQLAELLCLSELRGH